MTDWTQNRARRIRKIIELLELNPHGLRPDTIAKETQILLEITKERFYQYIDELEWSGLIIKKRDGRIALKNPPKQEK